jgi:hypothetical protein
MFTLRNLKMAAKDDNDITKISPIGDIRMLGASVTDRQVP